MVGEDGSRLRAIAFRVADGPEGVAIQRGEQLHVAGRLRADTWRGPGKVQIEVADIAKAVAASPTIFSCAPVRPRMMRRGNPMTDARKRFANQGAVRGPWRAYLDSLAQYRPDLHRYCRRLTGNVWDGEDLMQDTLVRVFSMLGKIDANLENPRAYLIRTATNLWIDRVRRSAREQAVPLAGNARVQTPRRRPPSSAMPRRRCSSRCTRRSARPS